MKKLAVAVVVLVVLVVAAALILPRVVDLNDYKDIVAAQVKLATGRDLVIEGSIDLALLPTPRVEVRNLRLANLDGAQAETMISVEAAVARIALLPLLRGEVQVEEFFLIEPVIELERLADGRVNWAFGDGGAAFGGAAFGGGAAVRLDNIAVRKGTIVYRDAASGFVERISGLNMDAGADSLTGPFRALGTMVMRGEAVRFELSLGALGKRPSRISLQVGVPTAKVELSFNGSLRNPTTDPEASGKLKVSGPSLARAAAVFDPEAVDGGALSALLAHEFSLSGEVEASARSAALNDIDFMFNGVQGSGALSAGFVGSPKIDLTLSLSRVDLDRLLDDTGSDAPRSGAGARPFALPASLRASLDLKIDALTFRHAVVRQLQVVATLDDGAIALQQASALLPGGSDISIFGRVDAFKGDPRFIGQIETSVDNLRAVFNWLQVPVPPVSPDRLRKLSFSGKLEVTPSIARLSELDLRIDQSRLSGGVNLALGPRLAFNAIVTLDRLNLDAYLPPDGAAGGAGNPLAALAGFDGALKARIDKLVYRSLPIEGLGIDARLKAGKLTLSSLAFEDFAGAQGAISGTIDTAGPSFDLTYGMQTGDLHGLLRTFDLAPTVPIDSLGKFSANGRVAGTLSALEVDTALALGDVSGSFAGKFSGLAGAPAVDIDIALSGRSLTGLLRRFGADIAVAPKQIDGAFALKGSIEGAAGDAMLDLALSAFGAEATIVGKVGGLPGAVSYDLVVGASHPDLGALAGAFADDAPDGDFGALRIAATVKGDGVQAHIGGLDAQIGPTRLRGDVRARWDGDRPRLVADLTAGDVVVDMFLAPAAGGNGSGTGSGASPAIVERWSRQPLDLSALRAVDVEATVAAESLRLRQYRFEKVLLNLKLADGVLDIEKLTGQLYGAPAELQGRIADGDTPSAELTLRLSGTDLKALLVDSAGIDKVSGKVDLSGRFETRGRSQFGMVSALTGRLDFEMRDGEIDGIDLARLNRQLGELNSERDFLNLAGAAMTGGKTRINALKGSFTAKAGVLRSDDLTADLDGGQGRAVATIDLPRWHLILDSEFRLTGHPDAPAIGVGLRGALDNPRREIRDRELRGYVTRKLLGSVLKKVVPKVGAGGVAGGILEALIGGGVQRPAPQETPQAQPQPEPTPQPTPEKLFENMFNQLLKGIVQ